MRVELSDVFYRCSDDFSLSSISMEIREGERIALMGDNGSGKTTLLNILSGLLIPSSGVITADSVNVHDNKRSLKEYHRRISYLIQFPERQIFSSTIYGEIAYPMKARGYGKREIEARCDEMLALLGLSAFNRSESPYILSGGQRRKLSLASQISYYPDLLLFDEPLSGLDGVSKRELLSSIDKLGNTIVVMSTHDVLSALRMDRLIVLDSGRIIYDGPSSVLLDMNKYCELGMKISDIAEIYAMLEERGIPERDAILKEVLYG